MAKWTFPEPNSEIDKLTKDDIAGLLSDSQLLTCLLQMRVDLWEHYDEAYDMFENSTELKG
jgi:hypothetical protein